MLTLTEEQKRIDGNHIKNTSVRMTNCCICFSGGDDLRDLVSVYCALAPKVRRTVKVIDPSQMPLPQVDSLPVQNDTCLFLFSISVL